MPTVVRVRVACRGREGQASLAVWGLGGTASLVSMDPTLVSGGRACELRAGGRMGRAARVARGWGKRR